MKYNIKRERERERERERNSLKPKLEKIMTGEKFLTIKSRN